MKTANADGRFFLHRSNRSMIVMWRRWHSVENPFPIHAEMILCSLCMWLLSFCLLQAVGHTDRIIQSSANTIFFDGATPQKSLENGRFLGLKHGVELGMKGSFIFGCPLVDPYYLLRLRGGGEVSGSEDLYTILGVASTSNADEVKAGYKWVRACSLLSWFSFVSYFESCKRGSLFLLLAVRLLSDRYQLIRICACSSTYLIADLWGLRVQSCGLVWSHISLVLQIGSAFLVDKGIRSTSADTDIEGSADCCSPFSLISASQRAQEASTHMASWQKPRKPGSWGAIQTNTACLRGRILHTRWSNSNRFTGGPMLFGSAKEYASRSIHVKDHHVWYPQCFLTVWNILSS